MASDAAYTVMVIEGNQDVGIRRLKSLNWNRRNRLSSRLKIESSFRMRNKKVHQEEGKIHEKDVQGRIPRVQHHEGGQVVLQGPVLPGERHYEEKGYDGKTEYCLGQSCEE